MALGHPKGLFPLFFTEMWERLAFYTMLGILLLYSTDVERGGLGLPAVQGNEIYGLYLAFVYFTPFIGGMIADKFLGYRRAVVIGGLMMSSGLFLMSIQGFTTFIGGLICLCLGNGLFKPNISVMVGNLYKPGDRKRDAGFNIFYMGINIGAFVANVLAASVRNEVGWLWTFRVAGFGLLIGLIILLSNWKVLERADRRPEASPDDTKFSSVLLTILLPAVVVGVGGYFLATYLVGLGIEIGMRPATFGFLAGSLPVLVYFVVLGLRAKPAEKPGLLALLPIYLAGGTFFMVLHLNGSAMTQWARDNTDREVSFLPGGLLQEAFPQYYRNVGEDTRLPHQKSLAVVEETAVARMYGQSRMDEAAVAKVAALPDIEVVEVSSDEAQEGQSEEHQRFQDRAVNVYEEGVVTVEETTDAHGHQVVTAKIPDGAEAKRRVAFVREVDGRRIATYVVDQETFDEVYDGYRERYGHDPDFLAPGDFLPVANSELYQSFNPLFVVAFTPLLVAFFGFLDRRNRGLTTARKIFLGLTLTTLSLLLMALAGYLSQNGEVKVAGLWLVGFYAIVTLGELCLSPMGLSLVTKLSPKRLVGLTMGGWFLATAFGNNFSGFFGGIQSSMTPMSFFLVLAAIAAGAAIIILVLLPWMDRTIKQYEE